MKLTCLLLIAVTITATACTKKPKDWRCTETKTTKAASGQATTQRDYERSGSDEETRQHEKDATATVINGTDTVTTAVKCFAKV